MDQIHLIFLTISIGGVNSMLLFCRVLIVIAIKFALSYFMTLPKWLDSILDLIVILIVIIMVKPRRQRS